MQKFCDTRLDGAFGMRMIMAGFYGAGTLFISLFVLILAGKLFGPLMGTILTCLFISAAIGVIADHVGLTPFPLLAVFWGEARPDDIDVLKTAASALPLSFAAAGMWLVLFGMVAPGAYYSVGILLVAPVTIGLQIIHVAAGAPREAFRASVKTLVMVLLAWLLIFPGVDKPNSAPPAEVEDPMRVPGP